MTKQWMDMDGVSHVGATPTAKWSTQFGLELVEGFRNAHTHTLTMNVVHADAQILAIGPLIGKTSTGASGFTTPYLDSPFGHDPFASLAG